MKNIFLIIAIAISNCYAYAQNTFPPIGNVGIGTTSPGANLSFQNVDTDPGNSGITWYNTAALNYGIYRTSGSWIAPNYQQIKIQWDTGILLNPGNAYGKCYVEVTGGGLRVSSGNVGIGTTDTKGYMLAVNGSAIATSMRVKPSGSWPDYVFQPTYKLLSLTEVKTYIDQNQHLPDMPSAQEVEKEGLDLGEINKQLTKKVEELTLYLIGQQKQIDELKKAMSQLQSKSK